MSTHSFPVNVAKEYGINEAIILQHIYFWFQKNRANKKNFYDGTYWSYNTTEAFNDIFPYFTQRQIQYCLDKLKKEDLILTANYNHNKFDRTLWYSISEKGLTYFENTILQNCKMEETKMENGKCENVKSITYINTDINTNIKKDCIAEQGNFSQNETLVLTQENFETKWFEFIKEEPKAGFEAKYETFKQNWFAKSKGKNKNDYKNWEAYFKEDWIKHEFNLDPALDPVKIAEQEALEREKRLGEMRSEKEEVEKYFEKNEYDANLTNVFQEKVKEARGENTLKQIEDVKVVEFNKSERCIILSGSEASRNTIYINHTSWINKLKLGVSFNKIYCLTLEELKKYKQKELDLNEIKTII